MTAPLTTVSVSDASGTSHMSDDDVRFFHDNGYLGPFRAFSLAEMDALRPEVERVLATDPPGHSRRDHNRHLDSPTVHQLATHPAVTGRMASILGPNLLLWRTHFFAKDPGGKEIPWHQDINSWPLEPPVVVSAWLAIDRASIETSCVQLIPGTHLRVVPHVQASSEMAFPEEADPAYVNLDSMVNMELEPGEFFLFTERTLHHSEMNSSPRRRIGLAIRVVPPITRIMKYDERSHRAVVIAGRDDMGFNTGPAGRP